MCIQFSQEYMSDHMLQKMLICRHCGSQGAAEQEPTDSWPVGQVEFCLNGIPFELKHTEFEYI